MRSLSSATIHLIISILLHNIPTIVLANEPIDCISVKSWQSSTGNGFTISAECPNSHPTMVSCGFETNIYGEVEFEGGYIDHTSHSRSRCYARNAENGDSVYAHARCCKFRQNVNCVTYDGIAANANDQESTIQCNANYPYMLGCTGNQFKKGFDGVYPGNPNSDHPQTLSGRGTFDNPTLFPMKNTCNAQNGNDDGTTANINCCSADIGLDCKLVYRDPIDAGKLYCPSGYTMMACMATNNNERANAWYVASSNFCYVRSYDSQQVFGSGICCSEMTLSPTASPTNVPTAAPTDVPTSTPTETTLPPTGSTQTPTLNPTRTRYPTINPTGSTLAPSTDPTMEPTMSTNDPTNAPSFAPTTAPSKKTYPPTSAPSMSPTALPTENTLNPSLNPTDAPTEIPTNVPSNTPSISTGNNQGLGEEDARNNEQLYMILFIIFGLLFLCMVCLVMAYFWKKNKTQRDEVDLNNKHVVLAGSPVAAQDGDSNGIDVTEGVSTNATHQLTTSGGGPVGIDASDGIVAYGTTSPTNGQMNGSKNDVFGVISDEDDQKSDVISYNM